MKMDLAGFAVSVLLFLAGCGEEHAGVIIETNTGNKAVARVIVSTAALNMKAGDTLALSAARFFRVADSLDCVAGVMELDSVPVGKYDSAEVRPVEGSARSVAVNWDVSPDSVNIDPALGAGAIFAASLVLPGGFSDLAGSSEAFYEMPFALRLAAGVKNPCLLDADGRMILLDSVASASDSVLYWGVMPRVIFSGSGAVDFDVIGKCQESSALRLPLGRHVEHFEGETPSEAAVASNPVRSGAAGGALWFDSSDYYRVITPFYPFVGGYYMAASLWINMDSSRQVKAYTRILSAKKDSVGFIVQQRSDRSAVNLRLDTRTGSYNRVVGTAEILDGSWHNYAFRVYGDSVAVFCDGSLIQKASFDSGEGFATAYNPAIGGSPNLVGGLDEIMFFDGTQSDGWMRLLYAFQKTALR